MEKGIVQTESSLNIQGTQGIKKTCRPVSERRWSRQRLKRVRLQPVFFEGMHERTRSGQRSISMVQAIQTPFPEVPRTPGSLPPATPPPEVPATPEPEIPSTPRNRELSDVQLVLTQVQEMIKDLWLIVRLIWRSLREAHQEAAEEKEDGKGEILASLFALLVVAILALFVSYYLAVH